MVAALVKSSQNFYVGIHIMSSDTRPTKIRVVGTQRTPVATSFGVRGSRLDRPVQTGPNIRIGRSVLQPMIAQAPAAREVIEISDDDEVQPAEPEVIEISDDEEMEIMDEPVEPVVQPVAQRVRPGPPILPPIVREARREMIAISDNDDVVVETVTTQRIESLVTPPQEEFVPNVTKFIVLSFKPTFEKGWAPDNFRQVNVMIECGEGCTRQVIRDNFGKLMTQALYKALRFKDALKNSRYWIMTQETNPKSLNTKFENQTFCTSRGCALKALHELKQEGDMNFIVDIPEQLVKVYNPQRVGWQNAEDYLPSAKFPRQLTLWPEGWKQPQQQAQLLQQQQQSRVRQVHPWSEEGKRLAARRDRWEQLYNPESIEGEDEMEEGS